MSPVTRTARCEHHCDLCGRSIPVGHRYVHERLTPWDHPDNEGFYAFRAHVRCRDAWSAMWGWNEGVISGDHHEFRTEVLGEDVDPDQGTGTWHPGLDVPLTTDERRRLA